MIEIENLRALIDENVLPLPTVDLPPLKAAGFILAEDAVSRDDSPRFDQSAMDGYAFADTEPESCRIAGTISAGDSPGAVLASGTSVRILTGAAVPEGAVFIARQEDCEVDASHVRLRPGVKLLPGENIRLRGGVAAAGDVVLRAGCRVLPGAVALLVSVGINQIRVISRASVVHVSTGAELVAEGHLPKPGQIPDCNGPMVAALAGAIGLPVERRQLGDDARALGLLVSEFAGNLLLISGGSGPGDHDHTLRALLEGGFKIHASRINSRPGKPLIFATRGSQLAFGLPGNPLSHWVCYHAFVRRALDRLHGESPAEFASAEFDRSFQPSADGRRMWTPALVSSGEKGLVAIPMPWKHSGDLTPLAKANALILDHPTAGKCRILLT